MKWVLLFLFILAMPIVLAQSPTPTTKIVTLSPTPSASPVVLTLTPAPAVLPIPIPTVTPTQVPQPPEWASELLGSVQSLPVVGPYVSKALLYIGILGALTTALVAFLLAVSESIQQVTSWSGLTVFAGQVQAFQDGKIMYWLKMLSLFNAKAPQSPVSQLANAVAEKTDKSS